MLQLHKIILPLCAGVFGVMTCHQLPTVSAALFPDTVPIAEAPCIPQTENSDNEAIPPITEQLPPAPEGASLTLPVPDTMEEVPVQTTVAAATPLTSTEKTIVTETMEAITETTTKTTDATEETTLEETETTVQETQESDTETNTEPVPVPEISAEPIDALSLFDTEETWFKAYMDYRTITDTSSQQYALQQEAWTDSQGLRRIGDDYLVAMGTGWLTEGCGERFLITLENGTQFTVMIGDIKADCHTDATRRYRPCESGANVVEFIVDTQCMTAEARDAGTISVYPGMEGNIAEIARLE